MDSSENSQPPSKRELQGPRPTPLKVRKDSHKIKKPPVVPPRQQQQQSSVPVQAQYRPPVIIYTVSPKVIHADPSEFMSVVQRLTGSTAGSTGLTSTAPAAYYSAGAAAASYDYLGSNYAATALTPRYDASTGKVLSPAARLATYESSKLESKGSSIDQLVSDDRAFLDRFGVAILSPVPTALPVISPNFFSPSMFVQNQNSSLSPYLFSPNFQNPSSAVAPHVLSSLVSPNPNYPNPNASQFASLFHELSPTNNNTMFDLSSFMSTPTNLLSTTILPSPSGVYWDIFNQFRDFQ